MYNSETEKIFPIIERHIKGKVLDFGCGAVKVTPDADSIDCRPGTAANYELRNKDVYGLSTLHFVNKERPQEGRHQLRYDTIFSSHVLEHIPYWQQALKEIIKCLNPNGTLILYLPDAEYYNNRTNPEHYHSFEYEVFIRLFKECFSEVEIIKHGPHYDEGCYSFFLVAKKV